MTIVAVGVLLHWTQANSFELVVRQSHGRPQERQNSGESRRDYWGDRPPYNLRINLIYHDCVQFGKQHSQYKAIMSPIVLSQKCCKEYFISLEVVNPQWDLTANTEIAPLTSLAGSAP